VSSFATGFSRPHGLAFDGSGNLYVANAGDGTVSMVTPAGVVTTFVSTGMGELNGIAIIAATAPPTTSNYTVIVNASPSTGGTVSGGGTFVSGSPDVQSVLATANSGYVFLNWTENGNVVSSSQRYYFTLSRNLNLVATFDEVLYQTLTPPNGAYSILPQGIDGETIVGKYYYYNGPTHGFIYNGTTYTTLDDPNSNQYTEATGVSGGNIVGYYFDEEGVSHGFIYNGTNYFTLDDPNADQVDEAHGTYAQAIESGNIVGYYVDGNNVYHGFIYNGTNYFTLDDPNADQVNASGTWALGISCGNVVGFYWATNGFHGFIYDGTNYSNLDGPNASQVGPSGICGGNIVGSYTDEGDVSHGFIFNRTSGASYSTFDDPNAANQIINRGSDEVVGTFANGISGSNIVGYYVDSNNVEHGFIATLTSISNCTIAVSAWPSSGGIVSGEGTFVVGSSQAVTATANSGYTFANWTVNGIVVSTSAIYDFILNTNLNLVANFTSNSVNYMITVSASPSAGGMVSGGGMFVSGSSQTVTATANNGFAFVNWMQNAIVISLSASYNFTLNSNLNLVANFTPTNPPPDGLTLMTNGFGIIQHRSWPDTLMIGKKYTVRAVPDAGYLFQNWVGGTSPPYSVLSTSASYKFTMESGLLLEANFFPNQFLVAHGAYSGLFAPASGERQQTNSGSFNFNLTTAGAVSGKLNLGSQTVQLTGKFQPDGSAEIVTKRHGQSTLTTSLQLDVANEAVSGTVTDGRFVAQLTGYQDIFTARLKAPYEGRYTVIIPGTTNPAIGPFGTSYGTVTVSNTGNISFAGSLADGTAISQSSVVSKDGYWPLYVSLYSGKGSLWGWNLFTNHTITAAPSLSWINSTNSCRTAVCRSGFTNQAAVLVGSAYNPGSEPLLGFTSGEVILAGGNLPFAITNGVTISARDKITLTNSLDETNKLKMSINKTNGVISGSFVNPDEPKQTNKIHGLILQGQTNAQGYFLGTNQSGTFLLEAP
jgi:hypothetical protein